MRLPHLPQAEILESGLPSSHSPGTRLGALAAEGPPQPSNAPPYPQRQRSDHWLRATCASAGTENLPGLLAESLRAPPFGQKREFLQGGHPPRENRHG